VRIPASQAPRTARSGSDRCAADSPHGSGRTTGPFFPRRFRAPESFVIDHRKAGRRRKKKDSRAFLAISTTPRAREEWRIGHQRSPFGHRDFGHHPQRVEKNDWPTAATCGPFINPSGKIGTPSPPREIRSPCDGSGMARNVGSGISLSPRMAQGIRRRIASSAGFGKFVSVVGVQISAATLLQIPRQAKAQGGRRGNGAAAKRRGDERLAHRRIIHGGGGAPSHW